MNQGGYPGGGPTQPYPGGSMPVPYPQAPAMGYPGAPGAPPSGYPGQGNPGGYPPPQGEHMT